MSLAVLPFHYLYWHYVLAWQDAWRIYLDWLWFIQRFFSIPVLIRTWLSPWRRLGESYPQGFDLSAWLSSLLVNGLMRLVGAVARSVLIILGLLSWLVFLIAGWLVAAIWLFLPLIVAGLLVAGVYLLV